MNFEPRGHPSLFSTCDLRPTGLPRVTHTDRGLAFPSQQPGLLAPDPRYPGFQFQSQFPIEKILPDFHPIPGYLDPRLICLAWPLGEPSPVSVRRFVFILPSFGVSYFTILFNTSITPNRLSLVARQKMWNPEDRDVDLHVRFCRHWKDLRAKKPPGNRS